MKIKFKIAPAEKQNLWRLIRLDEDGSEEEIDVGERAWVEWLMAFCVEARKAG